MKTPTVTYEEVQALVDKRFKKEHTPKEMLKHLNGMGWVMLSDEVRLLKFLNGANWLRRAK